MTVKEVFDLRKQGKIEEAYEAIRPMYAQHKGRYTSLCMFWTAADVFKLRLDQKRYDEAEKILQALKRMLPRVEEINQELEREHPTTPKSETKLPWEHNDPQQEGSSASAFIASATRRLATPAPAVLSCSAAEVPVASVSASEGLNAGQQAVLDCIKAHEGIKVPGISDLTNIPSKTIERHVSVLIARNLIEHRGSKKTGGYYVK